MELDVRGLKIGLDIDGVLADFMGKMCLDGLDVSRYYEEHELRDYFKKTDNIKSHWLSMARLVRPSLLKFKPVVYVTARPSQTKDWTQEWLDFNNFPAAPLIMAKDKPPVIEEYDLDRFVDDSPKNYKAILASGVRCTPWLMNTSYNQEVAVRNRLYSLYDLKG